MRDLAELQLWHENLTSWLDVGQEPVVAVLWQPVTSSTPEEAQVGPAYCVLTPAYALLR